MFEHDLIKLLRKAYPNHYQFFINRKLLKNRSSKAVENARIRLIKNEILSQGQVREPWFLGTFEIEFPDSQEKQFLVKPEDILLEDVWYEQDQYKEGKKRIVSHLTRERDRRVIKAAIQKAKQRYGKVFCEVCHFDFFQMYGERGMDFIECHHKVPLSERDDLGSITKIEDIALVCANCHRMIHRERNHLLSIEQLKKMIKYTWHTN